MKEALDQLSTYRLLNLDDHEIPKELRTNTLAIAVSFHKKEVREAIRIKSGNYPDITLHEKEDTYGE